MREECYCDEYHVYLPPEIARELLYPRLNDIILEADPEPELESGNLDYLEADSVHH